MAHKKAKKRFRKAFRHLEKVGMADHHRERVRPLKVRVDELLAMCKGAQDGAGVGGGVAGQGEGGPPAPGGNAGTVSYVYASAEQAAGGYGTGYTVSPDAVATGYMGLTAADLGTLRQSSKRFDQGFKAVAEFMCDEVVRQQAMQAQGEVCQLLLELYGGETTAPEPRV